MFCNTDSEEMLSLVSQAGGVGCLLHDTIHLASTIAVPLLQRQLQVRNRLGIQARNEHFAPS